MRKKLLKLLRQLETESGFMNEYFETDEQLDCDFDVDEYLDFPDFRFVIKRFNEVNVVMRDGFVIPYTSSSIRGELKRMEADGLIMIGTQEGKRWASVVRGNGNKVSGTFSLARGRDVLAATSLRLSNPSRRARRRSAPLRKQKSTLAGAFL